MAELKLRVSLDTSYLKSQISRLPLEFAGANVSIRPKFDRQVIVNEFKLLNRYIGSKKFNIVINTNLKAEIEAADRLVAALGRVQQAASGAKGGLPLGTKQLSLTGPKGGFTAAEIKTLFGAAIQGGLLDEKTLGKKRDQMVAALGSIGRDSIAGLLNGLKSGDADLQKAAQMLGDNLIKTTKASLGIASPSKEFEKIGKSVGEGFEKGTLSSMDDAFNALESKMRQRGKILDTVARGIFKMLGMDPASMLQQAREQRVVPARPPIAGLLPSSTAKGRLQQDFQSFMGAASGKPPVDQGPGRLALSNEALGRRVSAILQEYFKIAEVQVKESFNPRELKQSLNVFSYIAQSLRDAETRTKQARVAESVDSLMQAIDNSIKVAEARVRISSVQVSELGPRAQAALPGARVAGFLPGRPSQSSILELNNILAGAIREYFKSVARELERRGKAPLSATPLLPSGSPRNPPMLPPTGGTSGSIRISTGAYLGQPGFTRAPSMPSVTRPPLTGQSTPLASPLGSGYFAVGKGLKDIQSAYGQAKKFLDTKRFPVAGAITSLGSEFGNAIKQVLLFGTAYKALAFLTSLPGEAFNAAKGLATYKNQLQAVTAATGTFDQSLAFVDNLANRFNVPLASAREGFVKLFASMQPAGFDQGQVENLFTGISKAAAAFGLSADTVDRVNNAFAQMASKGQIMAEEVKGQLGDALPGALSLFAEAAQMSLSEFSKAMEDGAFKGKAMEQVLDNVGILLNTKFDAAAKGAAKTLQGAVIQIQNNLKLMYESFGPIVDAAAAAFGPEINSLIKDVTETVKVLTTALVGGGDGFDTLSPRAQAFYAAVQTLEPALRQAGAALTDLGSRLAALAPYFAQVLASVISFASSPLARAALMAALAIGTLTAAMKLLEVTGIKAVLKSIYTFIGTLTTGIPVACAIARVAVIGLKLVITGLFAGAVLIGLDFLVGKLLRIGDAANDSAKDLRGMAKELDRMTGAGDLEGLTGEFLSANAGLATARKANQKALSDLRAAKDLPERDDQGRRINFGKPLLVKTAQAAVDKTFGEVIARQAELTQATTARNNAVALKERQDAAAEEEAKKGLQKIDLSGGDGTGTGGKGAAEKRTPLDQLLDMESQRILKLNLSKADLRLTELITAAKLEGNEAEAESLEGLSNSLQLRIKLTAAQDFVNTLLDKEGEMVGKSLTQEQFSNKLQEANVEVQLLSNDLKASYLDMQVRENDADKKAQTALNEKIRQQLSLNRLLEDAAISAGVISPQQAAVSGQRREFQDQLLQAKEFGATPEQILSLEAFQAATPETGSLQEALRGIENEFNRLISTQEMVKTSANAIGDAFGNAFKGIITGSMTAREALAGFFQSVADSFADMAAKMIAEWTKMKIIGLVQSLLAPVAGGFAGAFGSSGPSFNAGAFSGPALSGGLSGAANYSSAFSGGMGGFNSSSFIPGFANGGIVTGPTLGLVGEGRYNEAVIPLPDGKSVPVDLGGAAGNQINSNITVNVSNGQAQSNATGSNSSELGRKIEGAVKQVIVGELRPGGLLAR